jgi:maleate isomerase
MLDAPPEVTTRIGLIIPSSNRLTEPHMRRYAPPGVEVHVTRLRMTGPSHVPLAQLLPRVIEATLALADARCDVIVFHCTASSMEAGLAGERQVLDALRTATTGHVASTASATRSAMSTLDVSKVVVISPYVAATHQHEIDFLTEAGLHVVGGRALGLAGGDQYITVSPADWLRIGCEEMEMRPDADAIFLSCTNIHTPEVVEPLETLIGRPVITSNQAVLWYALRVCGLNATVPGLGRLFQNDLPKRLSAAGERATIAPATRR